MSASLSETLANLRSFLGNSLSDIENKYAQAIQDKKALEKKVRQLQDENNRLSAKVQKLNGKLQHTQVKLSRKDEELQQKDKWWEAYKHMSQKRFRVMKKTGKFPAEVLEEYVNKTIQELITACADAEGRTKRTNASKLCRNKHSNRTRYEEISSSNKLDQTKDNIPQEQQGRCDGDESTRLYTVVAHGPDVLLLADGLIPATPDSTCLIGLPSATSTPVCADTQLADWAPITRLPASDSQFPVDLSHTQPHSPTIPSHASTICDKSRAATSDSSYSLLPPLQKYDKPRCAFDEVSRIGKVNQSEGERFVEQKLQKVSQEKPWHGGKRKRRDSEEQTCQQSQEHASSGASVFKVPEPHHHLQKHAKQSRPSVCTISDESKMETSVVDMFADHSQSGSANEDSNHGSQNDRPLADRKSECKTPIKECPSDCRKREEISNYKYIEVVRKKEERDKLNGYACRDCQKYFESLDLPKAELKERLKQCSRHRAKFSPPPSTPPDFWNLSFPDTQTYIDKGYLQTEPHPPHPRKKTRKKKAMP